MKKIKWKVLKKLKLETCGLDRIGKITVWVGGNKAMRNSF